MVGGKIIENAVVTLLADDGNSFTRRRLWCVDREGDECAVYVEDTQAAATIVPGDTCWWQSGRIYAKGDTLDLKKIGFSFDPRTKVAA